MIVRNTKPCITYVDSIFFYPGNNEITADNANILNSHPAFANKVKHGQLEIIGQNAVPAPLKATSAVKIATVSVATMNVENATKVIKGIFNKADLEKILESDVRQGVQNAVKSQIVRIDAMGNTEDTTGETSEATE